MADNPYLKDPDTQFADVARLSKKQAAEQARQLREAIRYHDRRYYVENDPVIADAVYDRLLARLQELEETHPELQTEDSPTRRVGGQPVDALRRARHTAPMLSLDSVLDMRHIERFHDRVRSSVDGDPMYVLEPKFDGLSVEVVYEDGRLVRATTRGDGQHGDDITHNVRRIRAVPLRLDGDPPPMVAVRGELYMPKAGFQRLNRHIVERGGEPFANPRNAAAGTVRQLDPAKVAADHLHVTFYDLLADEGAAFDTDQQVLEAFAAWGLPPDPHGGTARDVQGIAAFYQDLGERRDALDYEIDGVVVKVDDLSMRAALGTRARSPRWAIAWKFPPRKEITTLRDIVVQVGRTGHLTPVALLDPVDVSGVTVSRATLHNEEMVHKKDVRPGDVVRIQRAGDVIPEVVERVKGDKRRRGPAFSMPETCPACGADVVREGAFVVCPAGPSCPAQRTARIEHYASRRALDIRGLGPKVAQMLVDRGLVKDLADLYDLTSRDVQWLDGFAAPSAKKLIDNIQDTRKVPLGTFLYALGIPHVGREIARRITTQVGSLEALREADEEALLIAEGVGPQIARSVRHFFDEEHNQNLLDELEAAGVEVQGTRKQEGPLEGRTFVFTGALQDLTREEAQQRIERLGARATSSVSRQTDYVVVGQEPGSKLEAARKKDVKTLEEKEFKKLLAKYGNGG